MKHRAYLQALVLLPLAVLLSVGSLPAQQAPFAPRYVPPDISIEGMDAHYRDLAVVETDCRTDAEATLLADELIRQGALVAIISSPQRMLGWVPPEARAFVKAARLETAQGRIGVQAIAYTVDELRQAESLQAFSKREYNEADEAIRDYLAWVRSPMTPERQLALEQAELRYEALRDQLPNDEPVDMVTPIHIGEQSGDQIMATSFASAAYGHVDHTSFFLESQSGTGSWNWPTTVYNDYKTLYTNALAFWTSQASKYGRSMVTHWHLYGRTHSACQLNGEAVTIGEATFIPIVIDRITSGSPEDIGGLEPRHEWVLKYNSGMRSSTGHAQSICGFIAYKGTAGEGIWPHASSINWNDGKKEGLYFALDNQYWQAVPDPLANPLRNVIAHEIGHLWGAPDEYYDTQASCDFTYRGMKNDNCQREQTYGAYKMRGFDGIMKGNYTGGTSRGTPVHTGVLAAVDAVPRRLFRTIPEGYHLTVSNCDGGSRELYTATYLPISHDYCMTVAAEPTHVVGSTTWFFEKWEIRRLNSGAVEYTTYGPSLPSYMLSSTLYDPIQQVIAHYTNTPPDFMTSNTTLEAWLSHYGHAQYPAPNIALRWRTKYDMNEVKTLIEYDRSGTWVEVPTSCIVLYHPNYVPQGYWTGLRVHSIPLATGAIQPIQPDREYRFRIVGEFNTVRGNPSVAASIRTRPDVPTDTIFCRDLNEPNSLTSPKVLPSMGPGIDGYSVRGALTIDGASGEFSWYRPKPDVYRITAIGLSSSTFGDKLRLRLKVLDGSDFKPIFRAQRAGTTSWLSSSYNSGTDEYILSLGNDGEYLIQVDASITNIGGMYDLADRYTKKFGFGEYSIGIDIEASNPLVRVICPTCVRLRLPHPYPGLVVIDPPPPPDLVLPTRPGYKKGGTLQLNLHYIAPAGLIFDGFDGDLFGGTQNPLPVEINPNTPAGEHTLYPKTRDFPPSTCELVIINPEGPGGPLELRISKPYGTLVDAEAMAPTGYVFVGWGGDSSAITNPLPVVMWKHKTLIAYYRQKPCVPEKMPQWEHLLTVVNAKQGSIQLTYGMQGGAGDGLEAGQVDLPPVPPPGTFDVRWLNIPGSQGSVTDIRAIKASHVYQGRIQIGTGMAPARLTWSAPGLSSSFTMLLKVGSTPEMNIHTTSEYVFPDEGVYTFTVTVKEPDCPPPTEESDMIVDIQRIDPKEYPCVELELLLKNRPTGEPLAYGNPFHLKLYDRNSSGQSIPARITEMTQLDSTLLLRLCSDPDEDDPNREIVIIPEEDDPDKIKDTTRITLPPFIPDVTGNMFRFIHQNTGDWEMVSVPVEMTGALLGSLYPDPDTKLFRFDVTTGMYTGIDAMVLGEGYWLKTKTKSTLFVGNEVTTHTLSGLSGIGEPKGYGWNLVGSISHPVAVGSIVQNPAGSLRALFGWNATSGYVIPTRIDPSYGYWFRSDPGATFTLSGTSGAPPTGTTVYENTAASLSTIGTLTIQPGETGGQNLALAARALTSEELDILSLPLQPPAELFDARCGNGTLFLSPGNNELKLQHRGDVTLTLHPPRLALQSLVLRDETGSILHNFRTDAASSISVAVNGTRTLRLEYAATDQPLTFALQQNYPNPLHAGEQTVLQYSIARDASVRLDVYDLLGRCVATLANGARSAGQYSVTWTGTDDRGGFLPSGVYMYRLESDGQVLTRRCSILR
ncbi:MAG: T9SS type A sorting domain-containing protein [Bacteroidetes bacterium]|nr:T9SS type A sorting domain-containing protein [Bacteroidota bacterium]